MGGFFDRMSSGIQPESVIPHRRNGRNERPVASLDDLPGPEIHTDPRARETGANAGEAGHGHLL